jgi:carboxypeptidase Taq
MGKYDKKMQELRSRLVEIYDIDMMQALLGWDQSTYMPQGGGEARGRQMAYLARLSMERGTDKKLGKLLDDLQLYEESLPFDSDEASIIRVARRDFERLIKVPPSFMAEVTEHSSKSYMAWAEARPENDFKKVQPLLEKTLDYSRQFADFFPGYTHIADPLIDFADYGMKADSIRTLFTELRAELVPIMKAITSQSPADDSCLRGHFAEAKQMKFSEDVIRILGYDFNRGRIDKTHHPFMTKFSLGDVRITTRLKEDFLGENFFSVVHESGHAMYEQGINMAFEGTPLGGGTSAGVHESQSRLWENVVGRSRGFWEFFFPKLQDAFPELKNVSLDTFYRAINKVQKSLIRTDADEVTYNLHVMLRFDFEIQMLEGSLSIRDLPEAWHERFESDFGVVPPSDKDGALQDVHWYAGVIGGAFQGYTLGNILGAQFYSTALKAHPEIPNEMKQGQFNTLHGWLKDNIYQHGRKYTAPELVQRVTGTDISIDPYINYLKTKYGELYTL